MSARINTGDKKFDGAVLKLIAKGTSIPQAATAMSVSSGAMADAYFRLEPIADPTLVISGSKAQVAKKIVAVRNSGIRWERIAHRANMTVKQVKAIYTDTTGVSADSTYTGRGRHYERTVTSVRASRPNTRKAGSRKATTKKAAAK